MDETTNSMERRLLKPVACIDYRIGAKCVISRLNNGIICAQAAAIKVEDDTISFISAKDLRKPHEFKELVGDDIKINSSSRVGQVNIDSSINSVVVIDPSQASVIYHPGSENGLPTVVVNGPVNQPFRSSARGRRKNRSISYDTKGDPVFQVQLLYALKTGKIEDRLNALVAIPYSAWLHTRDGASPGTNLPLPSFDKLVEKLPEIIEDPQRFHHFVGRFLSASASTTSGLHSWHAWEKVADAAIIEAERMKEKSSKDTDERFLSAVRDVARDNEGIPIQNLVRKRWELLGSQGEWKDLRHKLGFDWLPTKNDWHKYWPHKP